MDDFEDNLKKALEDEVAEQERLRREQQEKQLRDIADGGCGTVNEDD